jgi:hypothetical protein
MRATSRDVGDAAGFAGDAALQKAITDYLPRTAWKPGWRWQLNAARPVGDCVLLWIGFPDVADGGVDLVYSKKDQRINWEFKGGERG